MSSVAGRWPAVSDSRWVHLVVLALPFVVVIIGWHGLSHSFNAFQGGDEPIHYGIVRVVAHQWPRPWLSGYGAWSGPLVYWLLATLALPFGGSMVAVRLIVCALSWGTCAIAYVLFRDRLQARPPDALALALLLAISPFFFGQSFHVLTDNPTWFFVVLGLERSLAYAQRPGLRRFATIAPGRRWSRSRLPPPPASWRWACSAPSRASSASSLACPSLIWPGRVCSGGSSSPWGRR
jgi:4-amino-4-deoxy-L-arabinose transferase-like glycosyltransferase